MNCLKFLRNSYSFITLLSLCIVLQNDFPQTVDALNTFAARSRQSPEGLENVVPSLRMPDTNMNDASWFMQSGISGAREFDDPPGMNYQWVHQTLKISLATQTTRYPIIVAFKDDGASKKPEVRLITKI